MHGKHLRRQTDHLSLQPLTTATNLL
jgi:hypothetical protein